MNKLYQKSPIGVSILWITCYVVGCSACDEASRLLGREKLLTFFFTLFLSILAVTMLKTKDSRRLWGFGKPVATANTFFYYLPLVFLCTCNLWFGVRLPASLTDAFFLTGTMIFVGFLEEFIFRCLLFRAMEKNGVKSAVIVSSLTFGIGHIVNLFNGSGADILSNLCQVFSAVAFGFLFVVIVYRGKSVYPCILCHSAINALSVFAKDPPSEVWEIVTALILTLGAGGYALFLSSRLPLPQRKSTE